MIKRLFISIVITIGILWVISTKVDLNRLLTLLVEIDWAAAVLLMIAISIYTLVADVLSFGCIYQRYLAPFVNQLHLISLRGVSMFVVSTVPPLAPLVPIGYFRKKGVKVSKVISAEVLVTLIDVFGGISVLSLALLFLSSGFDQRWMVVVWIWLFFVLSFSLLFRFRKHWRFSGLGRHGLLECFFCVKISHYFQVYTVRLSLLAAHLIVISNMLPLLSIELAFWQLLVFSPLFVSSAFLPISAGGYGGPQGVAVLLLVQFWHVTNIESAVAFSMLWSTFFLLGRLSVGGILTVPFLALNTEEN